MKKKIDWAGLKFQIAEEMGDCMDIMYARYDWNQDQVKYFLLNHKEHDGVSSFCYLLSKEGYTFETMPTLKLKQRPNPFKLAWLFFRFIKLTKAAKATWKKRVSENGKSDGYVYAYFPEELTRAIEEKAQAEKSSITSSFLWAIDKISVREFLNLGSERKWVSPINMRTASMYGNCSSSIMINLNGDVHPSEIQNTLKNYLKQGLHWGAFMYSNLVRFVGIKGARKVARGIKEMGTGVFSNMGHWPYDGLVATEQVKSPATHWCSIAPASSILPVSSTSYIWNNKLTLSLQLHPSLKVNLVEAEKVMKEWILEVLKRYGLEERMREVRVRPISRIEAYKIAQKEINI